MKLMKPVIYTEVKKQPKKETVMEPKIVKPIKEIKKEEPIKEIKKEKPVEKKRKGFFKK